MMNLMLYSIGGCGTAVYKLLYYSHPPFSKTLEATFLTE